MFKLVVVQLAHKLSDVAGTNPWPKPKGKTIMTSLSYPNFLISLST